MADNPGIKSKTVASTGKMTIQLFPAYAPRNHVKEMSANKKNE
jgi:hypothetical protein